MSILSYFLWIILCIGIIYIVWFVMHDILNHVYGQTTTKAPPAVIPTPVPQPTPTAPDPNLQYLPQKAYVQAYAPEIGIPQSQQPLQVVPQVVPVQQQSTGGFNMTEILGVLGTLTGAGAYLKGHLVGKLANKTAEITQEQSAQIVKGAQVDQCLANRVYKNMADGGASINDAPEIKLEKLAADKEAAIKTASKA